MKKKLSLFVLLALCVCGLHGMKYLSPRVINFIREKVRGKLSNIASIDSSELTGGQVFKNIMILYRNAPTAFQDLVRLHKYPLFGGFIRMRGDSVSILRRYNLIDKDGVLTDQVDNVLKFVMAELEQMEKDFKEQAGDI